MADGVSIGHSDRSAAREFREGVRDSAPFLLSIVPYGVIVGALAGDKGFTWLEALLQSFLFFAGASQIVALELYGLQTPVWAIVLAIFPVKFRMVLYSAAKGRKLEPISKPRMVGVMYLLQDISFALNISRAERQKLTFAYAMGNGIIMFALWQACTVIGVVFGGLVEDPKAIGLDMLVPLYFLLLVMGFRAKPGFLIFFIASFSMAALVYQTFGNPYHIAAGGLFGMALAAWRARPEEAQGGLNGHG